jgi:beta-glucanase (GH16 family)
MRSSSLLAFIAFFAFPGGPCLFAGEPTTAPSDPPRKLLWSDEFDGNALDRSKWNFDLANGFHPQDNQNIWISGWGNNELEYYTDRPENVYVKDGLLHIRAARESYQGCSFTSARLTTRGLFARAFGRFEFRAKLPIGKGLWPAIWLLPADNAYGPWPASGEIDILEARGDRPTQIFGTIHFGCAAAADTASATATLPNNSTIANFHVYALEWKPGEMRWFIDGECYATQRKWWSSSKPAAHGPPDADDLNPPHAPFDKPFYLIINLAVGGNFAGNPDADTEFPQEMLIDYVRVYE